MAEHTSLSVNRIIKGTGKNSPFRRTLLREAQILSSLHHPNIPLAYDVEEDEEYLYLVEEYIEGENLTKYCTHSLLDEDEILSFISQIGSVIKYLHELPERILYLDLKPENVIVSGDKAWLIDFGSAVIQSDSADNRQAVSHSPGFTAPEQASKRKVDCSTDVYALGKLLEYMLCHSSVYPGRRQYYETLAQRCISQLPWRRISSAGIFVRMLEKRKAETKVPGRRNRLCRGKCVQIGVVGLHPGVGATHVTIAAANTLTRYGSVAVVERSDHCDLRCIAGEGSAQHDGFAAAIRRIVYYPSDVAVTEEQLIEHGYSYIVYDLGSNPARAEKLLERCDLCLMVAGAAMWRQNDLHFQGGTGSDTAGANRYILLNLAEESKLGNYAGLPTLAFPYEHDPFHPGRELIKLFEQTIR